MTLKRSILGGRMEIRTSIVQAGVRAVPDAHLEREIPATFFLLANMLEAAGPELRSILDQPLFGIQSHSFTQ